MQLVRWLQKDHKNYSLSQEGFILAYENCLLSEERFAGNCSNSARVSMNGSGPLGHLLSGLLDGKWQGWEEQVEADPFLENPRATDLRILKPCFMEQFVSDSENTRHAEVGRASRDGDARIAG